MAKTSTKPRKTDKKESADKSTPRQLKTPTHKSFRLGKRVKGKKILGAFRLFAASVGILRQNWKVFLGIVLVFGVLNALLVQGFSAAGNVNDTKSNLDQALTGNWSQLVSSLTVFIYLLGSSGNTASPTARAYQLMLALVVSLALIWVLRQVYVGQKVRVRDGFYQGMSPLVPFVLVLLVIFLQLIPMALGLMLYGIVVGNDVAASFVEQILWAIFAFSMSLVTLYMISSSLFALYIVTLPDMTPLKALRSARQLAANRRWAVLRKVFFLPLALVVLAAIIVLPFILWATPLAAWVFFAITMLLLPVTHSYMYALYRSML